MSILANLVGLIFGLLLMIFVMVAVAASLYLTFKWADYHDQKELEKFIDDAENKP